MSVDDGVVLERMGGIDCQNTRNEAMMQNSLVVSKDVKHFQD